MNTRISLFLPVGLVFFSYTTTCTIVFLSIAKLWPDLMKVWAEKENRFLTFPYRGDGLKFWIRFTAGVVILLAFIEHGLFIANSAYNKYKVVAKSNLTIDAPLSYFLEDQFSFIFDRISFSLPLGLIVEIMNLSFTFGWNYMELFVMMVSIGIVMRFKQINRRLDEIRGLVRQTLSKTGDFESFSSDSA
jgi:gustatory receptor